MTVVDRWRSWPWLNRLNHAGAGGLTITHSVLLGIYLIGTFGVLLCAVVRTGDYGAFLDPGLERLGDPKDSIPIGPPELWNPLFWLFAIPYVIVVYGRPLPLLGLLLGVIFLAKARGRSVRAAGFTVVWAALSVMAFSSYGSAIHHWLLD